MKDIGNAYADLKSGTLVSFKISMIFTVIFSACLGDDLNIRNVLITFCKFVETKRKQNGII